MPLLTLSRWASDRGQGFPWSWPWGDRCRQFRPGLACAIIKPARQPHRAQTSEGFSADL